MKNALTKNLDDPMLEAMPVIPTDRSDTVQEIPEKPTQDLIAQALQDRPELAESDIDLQNRQISRKAAETRCCPTLTLVGFYGGTGLAGELNPVLHAANTPICAHQLVGRPSTTPSTIPSPDYFVGLNLNIPIRNRVAKADQYRSELEYRQAELREQQLKKQIRIEVRNAQYALEQSRARVDAAQKSARPGAQDLRHHAERAGPGCGIELPDADGAARPGAGGTRPGERQHGVPEIESSSCSVPPAPLWKIMAFKSRTQWMAPRLRETQLAKNHKATEIYAAQDATSDAGSEPPSATRDAFSPLTISRTSSRPLELLLRPAGLRS